MRLSEWRAAAPSRESMSAKVLAVLGPVVSALGGGEDPECWVSWGDDAAVRYTLLAMTPGGLAIVNLRVNVPGEGPRASGKLVRWGRVQLGELDVEAQAGHRIASVQVEGQVLRAVDAAADHVTTFVQQVMAAIDGRPLPAPGPRGRRKPAKAGVAGKGKPSIAPSSRLAKAGSPTALRSGTATPAARPSRTPAG